jgi:hypothetical protein
VQHFVLAGDHWINLDNVLWVRRAEDSTQAGVGGIPTAGGVFTYTVHFIGGETLMVGEAAAEDLLRVINSDQP